MTTVKTPPSPVLFPQVHKDDVQVFEKALRPDSFSLKTQRAVLFDLTHYIRWHVVEKKTQNVSLNALTKEDIEKYQAYCKNTLQHAPATIQRRLLHLRQLFQIAVELKKVRVSPIK